MCERYYAEKWDSYIGPEGLAAYKVVLGPSELLSHKDVWNTGPYLGKNSKIRWNRWMTSTPRESYQGPDKAFRRGFHGFCFYWSLDDAKLHCSNDPRGRLKVIPVRVCGWVKRARGNFGIKCYLAEKIKFIREEVDEFLGRGL